MKRTYRALVLIIVTAAEKHSCPIPMTELSFWNIASPYRPKAQKKTIIASEEAINIQARYFLRLKASLR